MGEYLRGRRLATARRTEELKSLLSESVELAEQKACVYVTGSFGRVEAGTNSDLDVFIVGGTEKGRRRLSRLDEICLKANLIEAGRELRFQEFSGDGEYLVHYTVEALIKALGHPQDDANNTFTARLLLLLESKPLLGEGVYQEAIDQVIAAYWGDFEDHRDEFVPAFLANDVLRLWRTFCVNYEARTAREPKEKKAKRKLKNYKLKHSRLLTCYSALAYLLAVFGKHGTVSPEQARTMTELTPSERLEVLVENYGVDPDTVGTIIQSYETFLCNTDTPEDQLLGKFMDPGTGRRLFQEANAFGDQVAMLLDHVGRDTKLHRLLVV